MTFRELLCEQTYLQGVKMTFLGILVLWQRPRRRNSWQWVMHQKYVQKQVEESIKVTVADLGSLYGQVWNFVKLVSPLKEFVLCFHPAQVF